MIGVDLIGQIRRAYFEQHRSIKEIVRTLKVSRATVRKVLRSHKTEFKYTRGVQPTPKLGDWVEVLTEIIEKEAKLPKRERRSTQRLFEELRGRHVLQEQELGTGRLLSLCAIPVFHPAKARLRCARLCEPQLSRPSFFVSLRSVRAPPFLVQLGLFRNWA